MGDRLDELLGELASRADDHGPDGLEAAVWARVDVRQAAASRLRAGVALQCMISACALLVGFSYEAYQRSAPPSSRYPDAYVKLLDGSTVAEAGSFQVLR